MNLENKSVPELKEELTQTMSIVETNTAQWIRVKARERATEIEAVIQEKLRQ